MMYIFKTFLNINVIPNLQRINGVGEANVFGGKNYSMRVWLGSRKISSLRNYSNRSYQCN
ncbi:efflux RND transporter permease subunit [Chryseobacterium indoltheticum]|uniref:efflux RND transporter permease subunit n=1 Tax=Chryseobacterium indoltheticum TaxID=254 RepID=UPI003F496BD2